MKVARRIEDVAQLAGVRALAVAQRMDPRVRAIQLTDVQRETGTGMAFSRALDGRGDPIELPGSVTIDDCIRDYERAPSHDDAHMLRADGLDTEADRRRNQKALTRARHQRQESVEVLARSHRDHLRVLADHYETNDVDRIETNWRRIDHDTRDPIRVTAMYDADGGLLWSADRYGDGPDDEQLTRFADAVESTYFDIDSSTDHRIDTMPTLRELAPEMLEPRLAEPRDSADPSLPPPLF